MYTNVCVPGGRGGWPWPTRPRWEPCSGATEPAPCAWEPDPGAPEPAPGAWEPDHAGNLVLKESTPRASEPRNLLLELRILFMEPRNRRAGAWELVTGTLERSAWSPRTCFLQLETFASAPERGPGAKRVRFLAQMLVFYVLGPAPGATLPLQRSWLLQRSTLPQRSRSCSRS